MTNDKKKMLEDIISSGNCNKYQCHDDDTKCILYEYCMTRQVPIPEDYNCLMKGVVKLAHRMLVLEELLS